MPNTKKDMASRYATAHARRDHKRRPDMRPRPAPGEANGPDGSIDDDRLPTGQFTAPVIVSTPPLRPISTPTPGPRQPLTPRPARPPVGRVPGAGLRAAAPLRPGVTAITTVDYTHLKSDLRRILILSLCLLILLIVLNLLLNR